MSRNCYYCDSDDDTRPYGPGGTWVCYPCATATPERDAAAKAAFLAQFDAASALSRVIFIGEEGPVPQIGGDDEH